ncbi:MAG: CAP domain-containing protein [Deltaproteobacteria bacterium]|nr:CAP domain-containing protein [Deltaproteobacteria bacterium]
MLVGLLAAGLLTFCPQVLPLVKPVFTPAATHPPAPVVPLPGVNYLAKVENLVFDLTNQARRAKGLAPLSKDDELRQVARAYSADMLVRRFFDHTTPDGVEFDARITDQYHHRVFLVGENIWFSSGRTLGNPQRLAKEIVADWLSSPGHRENLLSPEFTHLGVGISARHQTIRATQEFVGRRKAFSFGGLLGQPH